MKGNDLDQGPDHVPGAGQGKPLLIFFSENHHFTVTSFYF